MLAGPTGSNARLVLLFAVIALASADYEEYNAPYSQMSFSSVWGNQVAGASQFSHANARLDSDQGWSAYGNPSGLSQRGEYIQFDLGTPQSVAGVVTQSRSSRSFCCSEQRVTEYKVEVSLDASTWTPVDSDFVFQGNQHLADAEARVENRFSYPYTARYVKIVVWNYYAHATMRAGLVLYTGPPSAVCTSEEASNECSQFALCSKEVMTGDFNCTCRDGFNGDGSTCVDINECGTETTGCDVNAYCHNKNGSYACVCQEGFVGDGYWCSGDAWGLRAVFEIEELSGRRSLTPEQVTQMKQEYVSLLVDALMPANSSMVSGMPVSFGALHYGNTVLEVLEIEASDQLTFVALFSSKEDANLTLQAVQASPPPLGWVLLGAARTVVDGPELYRWVNPTTSAPIEVNPTGLTVDRVWFDTSCLASGCWKVAVTYTVGVDNFNVFYLPRTDGDDSLSYDQSYDAPDATWVISPEDTFVPTNHPCTSVDYEASIDPSATPASVTACCIPEFLAMYRPVQTFADAISAPLQSALNSVCSTGLRDRDIARSSIPVIAKRGQTADDTTVFERPIAPAVEGISGDIFQAEEHGVFAEGAFASLTSHINSTGVVDAYVGIYEAVLTLDEVELRKYAGMLTGTVGVEHTVDTFVGLAEFSPTGTFILDPFTTQVNIHLEKTSFFTVSTHGTNDYTFLEYVNMRLVAIYNEDADFSGADESGDRTVRTSSSEQANYVQVTFTLGTQYAVDPAGSPLIPLDSVRAGHGTFFDAADLAQMCSEWDDGTFDDMSLFNTRLTQSCAPNAAMCASPGSIPDSFVVFNIPLGLDYFEGDAGGASTSLSNNIFVDMVVSATEADPPGDDAPNDGGDPKQMKTTLTASIPIVEGGVNIFCDGFTAKTDLKDVADADIVVGSASTMEELTRLRIKEDIASTQMDPSAITEINSDSIEAGLMTLVLKGNSSYFLSNSGRASVTLELEDVITIHIMEDDGNGADTTVSSDVSDLITAAPDDNSLPSGLDTDGYALNGAFYFVIDRSSQRAHLEPSADLLELCPFNPPRPDGSVGLETCVTRRDVRFRDYPWRSGASSTAMEICTAGAAPGTELSTHGSCPSASGSSSDEAKFFVTILGDSDYAKALANSYAAIISDKYNLNGRFRRAFWINPGYEWTPTQTGGTPIFSVSQKLYLFALITLDEGLTDDAGQGVPGVGPSLGRRMLLQSTTDEKLQDGESSVGADVFQFESTPTSIMAQAFKVPEESVATFKVRLQLTQAEACMSQTELQASLRATLDDYLSSSASPLHTVQVTKLAVDTGGVQCGRRALRSLLATGFSDATAELTMLVVFMEGSEPAISLDKIATFAGVQAIEPLVVSSKVNFASTDYIPPPPPFASGSESESSSSNIALIAGAAGGAVALVVLVGAAVLVLRRRQVEVATPMQGISVSDLKSQLANEA